MPNPALWADDSFREDCRMAGLEQYPRRRYHGPTQRPRCEACGQRFDADELNDSGVCGTCEKEIAAMEEGRV